MKNEDNWAFTAMFCCKKIVKLKWDPVEIDKITIELSLCHNSDFRISISLQPDGVNLWYFKLRLFN